MLSGDKADRTVRLIAHIAALQHLLARPEYH
jgi:hypothetical protein